MPRIERNTRTPARPRLLPTRWRGEAEGYVADLAASPDGLLLAAASVEGPVTLFDLKSGKVRHALSGHGFGTAALHWNRDGQLLASSGQDGRAKLWNAWSGECLAELEGGSAWVERVAFSPDGRLVATAAGRTVRLWSAAGELVREVGDFGSTVSDLAWRPGRTGDEAELACAAYGGITLIRPEYPGTERKFEWKGSTLVIAWSPDGRFIATGDQDATVHFWMRETGRDLQMYGYPTKVRELAWDPTSRLLATGGGPVVTVWDCSGKGPEGRTPISLSGAGERNVSALRFQRKGRLLASGTLDGEVALWDPLRQNTPVALESEDSEVTSFSWSVNDRLLACGAGDGSVVVYEP